MIDVTEFGEPAQTFLVRDVNEEVGPATFKIFSGLLRAQKGADNKMRLMGTASSSTTDMHGDTMQISALEDMERAAANNLTIFLNHSYSVPEDVAGSVEYAKIFQRGNTADLSTVWDLDFGIVINDANPRAVSAWEAINNGTKLGLSIGAMIPEGGAVRDKKSGAFSISHVDLLETSIVGIPANPRSWVQSAVKALKTAELTQLQPLLVAGVTADEVLAAPPAEVEDSEEAAETTNDETDEGGDADDGGSQEASPSEPDTEPATEKSVEPDEFVSDSSEAVNSLSEALTLLETTLGRLEIERTARREADERVEQAERERDEAIEKSREMFAAASLIVEKVANMPIGRKTVVREAQKDLSSLERFYGPELVKLIAR